MSRSPKRAERYDGIFIAFDSSVKRRRLIEKSASVNIVHGLIFC